MGKTYKPIDLEKTSAPMQDFLFLIFFLKFFLCIMIDHNMVCYIDKEVISETFFMRDNYSGFFFLSISSCIPRMSECCNQHIYL